MFIGAKASLRNFRTICNLALAAGLSFLAAGLTMAQTLPWMDPTLPPATRAALLVSAMTLAQMEEQMHGQPGPIPEVPSCGNNAGRHVPGIPALDIPTFRISNGPVGVGQGDCSPTAKATAIVTSLGLAASFDPAQATAYGDLVGTEAIDVGVHVIEGPGMDMARIPQGGRNFEYMGEDPFLTGSTAVPYIQAMQSHGIIGMSKHFVGNDQETNRTSVNEIIDDRTLHEINLLHALSLATTADEKRPTKPEDVATLWLNGTKVTVAGFKELAPLKNLTTLYLNRAQATGAGLKDLQKALPKCKIVTGP